MKSILVVGSGLAGLSAARAARNLGFDGSLTIVGDEQERPYDRPPLSKDYLSGALPRESLGLETDTDDLDARWLLGVRAVSLDPATRSVRTSDGGEVHADGVVLATGSAAMLSTDLTGPAGARPANLTTLRTVADADRLRDQLRPGRQLVIVGAGLIGTEVAATARARGCEVVVLARESVPLARIYGAEMAVHVAALHDRHGVELIREAFVKRVEIVDSTVRSITLTSGRVLPTDIVLVAIGARPEMDWLVRSGLELGDGVVCDSHGRTSAAGVVAVGDCAAWFDRHLERAHRTQHWTDALERPVLAVAALLEVEAPRQRPHLPYFWSDQYDRRIQMAGYASLADSVRVEQGDPGAGAFLALYRRGDDPVAVLGVSQPREFTRWRKTIAAALASTSVQTRPSADAAPAASGPAPYETPST